MKGLSICLGALLISLAVSGCSKSVDNSASETNITENTMNSTDLAELTLSERCVKKTEKVIDSLHEKKWGDIISSFAEKLQANQSESDWSAIQSQLSLLSGDFVEKVAWSVVYQHNEPVVEYVVRYEKIIYWYFGYFNNKGEMIGFRVRDSLKAKEWPVCHADCVFDSERYIDSFRRKDWNDMRSRSTPLLASVLTDEFLEKAYGLVMTDLGGYVSLVSRTASKNNGSTIVHHINNHRKGQFIVDIKFLSNGKVDKFSVRPPKINKPGEPDPQAKELPDPYAPVVNDTLAEEPVKIVADENYPLDGLLTMPKSATKPPVVILIHGSGPGDMNETISVNKPFQDIALGLASKGVAVLRYHKRTRMYGGKMTQAEATLKNEYFDDLSAAIKLVSSDERLGKIFVLGHSLGGSLIPAISVEHPELSGVISMAGSMRSMAVSATEQIQAQIDAVRATNVEDDIKTAEAQALPILEDLKKVSEITADTPDDLILFNVPVHYWRDVFKYVNADFVPQMKHPFFIAQGGADFQVYPDRDYKIWQDLACNRDNVTCMLYPNLTHYMAPSPGYGDARDYMGEFHVSGEFLEDVAKFVLAH